MGSRIATESLRVNRDIVMAAKKQAFKDRQKHTPTEAMLALAQMQPRPRSLLNFASDGEKAKIIAQVTRTEVYDPVTTALICMEHGADAISFFTDHSIYDNDLDDFLMVARALPTTPIIYQNYVMSDYAVVAARAADASAVAIYSSVLEEQQIRSVATMVQRWKMSTVIQVDNARQLEIALSLSPHVLAFGDHLSGQIAATVDQLREIRPEIPDYCRVILLHTLSTLDEISLALLAEPDGIIVSASLLKNERNARRVRALIDASI